MVCLSISRIGIGINSGGVVNGIVAPVISLLSGSGYAGSVYESTVAGQWFADGVAISGETGSTYTRTLATESKALSQAGSDAIAALWAPHNMTSVTMLDYFDTAGGITQATGVADWTGRMGNLSMQAATASRQPAYDTSGPYPKITSDGSDDVMTASSVASFPTGDNPFFQFIVGVPDVRPNVNANVAIGYGQQSGARHTIGLTFRDVFATSYDGYGDSVSYSPLPTLAIASLRSGNSVNPLVLDVNGVKTTGFTAPMGLVNDTATLFARSSFNNYNTKISAYFAGFGSGQPSDAEIKKLEGWAAHKLNSKGISELLSYLPAAHPYKTEAPLA